ncbi:multidrug efflux MFS transporter [Cohnella sp. LGH]|uniref:DHA2 family efflux MFS transporter permease subunit n=1 Tax=Cohnella sp. LGH TaxID=1619153 RepID=UPI001ADC4990|nr:DHA2 family efflux MFS transporter permease subunit [Cohnella sp. LGH]QTH44561.1 multidrug efflux MFS transporter [Cohnella sp. LGH]
MNTERFGGKGSPKRGPMLAALLVGAFVSILNETLLNIAYPQLMGEFGVSSSTVQWLSTGYLLVIGILVPVTALLQQWFTTRQLFLSAMALFLSGTIVCAVAPWFGMLLAGRIVQALGTGLMLPVLMTTILYLFPPEKRGGAMGLIGLVIMFAPAIGPTLSGLIVDSLSWRWLFYMVVPLAGLSILTAGIYLKNVSERTKPRVDVVSILLSSAGFGGIVYGFNRAGGGSWSDPGTICTLVVGGAAIILFARRQLIVRAPLLELKVFKYSRFSIAMLLIFLMMMLMFAYMILLPIYLQTVLSMTAFHSGLALLPGGILNGVMAPISGKLFDKFGPRVLALPGLALMTLAAWLFAGIESSTEVGMVVLFHTMLLTGFSMALMPVQTTGLNELPRHLYSHGTSILNTFQQVAGAVGTALFIGVMSSGTNAYLKAFGAPDSPAEASAGIVAGLQDAFAVSAILSLATLILGLFIGRSRTQ